MLALNLRYCFSKNNCKTGFGYLNSKTSRAKNKSGKKLSTVLNFLEVCFLTTTLYKYITEDGKKCADTFTEVESQTLWSYPGMVQRWKFYKVSLKTFLLGPFFIRLFHTYKDSQLTDTLSDFSVFLCIFLNMQLPYLRFPDNSHVCLALGPSSQ